MVMAIRSDRAREMLGVRCDAVDAIHGRLDAGVAERKTIACGEQRHLQELGLGWIR